MAQIVCVDKDTVREGQEIGDIVSIHDDDVELSGAGYTGFRIIKLPGTARQIMDELNKLMPTIKTCFRLPVGANTWTDTPPEESEFWLDGLNWKQVTVKPKFSFNITDLKTAETQSTSPFLTDAQKLIAVKSLTVFKVKEIAENQTIVEIVTSG